MAHQATTAVGLALAQPKVPLLYVFHASAPLEERFLRRRSGGLRRAKSILLDPLLVVLERIAVRRAATIAVLSEYSRELLVARHPAARDRVALVRGGLDFDRFAGGDPARARVSQSLPDDIPFVLTVRRLEPRMGVEELLRATALLSQRGVRVTVGVAGAGPLGDRLRELSRTLGIDGHVRFFGRVPDEALPDLYAAADLFVLPTVAYEGFGISTIESLAAGTPVVGTPVGATPEILGPLEPRLLAEGTSPEQLAAAIEAGLASLSPALRRRCRDYAHSTYRWEAAIEPWKAALRRTIG
jgi:glycosyltransferase involved in cell wall biosynthesis